MQRKFKTHLSRHSLLVPFVLFGVPALYSSGRLAIAAPDATPKAAQPRAEAPAKFAHKYIEFALKGCDRVERNLPEIERIAEIVATRHLAGGTIEALRNNQGVVEEFTGRSGGMMSFGAGSPWKKERTVAEDANNVMFVGWDRAPVPDALEKLKLLKAKGTYLIGLGPRNMPELADHVALYDAWLDTGFDADDTVVKTAGNTRAGRGNLLVNMLNGWVLEAEIISALTRHGKMPLMWKSYRTEDGHAWGDRYYGKMAFHDDITVPPVAVGVLGRAYLQEIRDNIQRFQQTQMPGVVKAAVLIIDEFTQGRKTIVATAGHAPFTFVSKYEDAEWGTNYDFEDSVEAHRQAYEKTPEGALVLRLGYTGMHDLEAATFEAKKQRVILLTSENPRPEWKVPEDKVLVHIDMGWVFGDAAVTLPGYPIKVLPPSGIMQIVAYESVNVEVLGKVHGTRGTTVGF